MNALTRSATAGLMISLLLAASLAHAVSRPGDGPFREVSPTDRIQIDPAYFDDDALRMATHFPYFGALQGPDCNEAGTANPRAVPLGDRGLGLSAGYQFARGFDTSLDYFQVDRDVAASPRFSSAPETEDYRVDLKFQLRGGLGSSGLNLGFGGWKWKGFPNINPGWPGAANADYGFDADPSTGTFGADGGLQIKVRGDIDLGLEGAGDLHYEAPSGSDPIVVPALGFRSFNIQGSADQLGGLGSRFRTRELDIGGTPFTSLKVKDRKFGPVYNELVVLQLTFEIDGCRYVLTPPADPHYQRTGRNGGGSWGQPLDDQWAIKRVGYTDDERSAWNEVPDTAAPVVVAVIDTGLDWHHLEIDPANVWRNPGEVPDNGVDDDGNGFVDDVIGWDFLGRHNKPWDFDGHGTVVAGIIAARQDNGAGIAGINPHAKLMVLKAVNNFGTTRASYLAEAIVYAADNGARVINISVGGPHTSMMEQAAIDYAHSKGVLVVAAAGNEGVELEDYGPGGGDHVLTVGATHTDDRAAGFSNYGERVDLVAPGVDVLSLRARYTDANYRGTDEYAIGDHYVGEDRRYLHVSGTSFSAPIVAATAALLMAKRPELSAAEVERILLATAEDLEYPGVDAHTGAGMLDARTALGVGTDFYVTAQIDGVGLIQTEAGNMLQVRGTADAQVFKRAWLEIGAGERPGSWKAVGRKIKFPVRDGELSKLYLGDFRGSELWQVVVNVEHKNGAIKRAIYPVRIK